LSVQPELENISETEEELRREEPQEHTVNVIGGRNFKMVRVRRNLHNTCMVCRRSAMTTYNPD